ncbi:PQQ-dependent sugar dehydrogenase [Streptomyces olivaceoviridis]
MSRSALSAHWIRPAMGAFTAAAAVMAVGVSGPPATATEPPSVPHAQDSGAGASRAGGAPAGISTLADKLTTPWGISFLRGHKAALVTERDSAVVWKIARDGAKKKVGTVPGAVWSESRDKGGLLGVAVSPTWNGTTDKDVFFMETTAKDNRVVRMRFDGTRLSEATPILTGIRRDPNDTRHNGGQIAFGPDGYLYVATGDAFERKLAQDKKSPNGKILRITKTGAAAPGNPFGNRVYSYGHRNPQGLAWDRSGRLWETEIGAEKWDELNLVKPGKNYGWPTCQGNCSASGMTNPKMVWDPDKGGVPAQIAVVNDVIYATTLNGRRLWRMPIDATGQDVEHATSYYNGTYGRLRAIARVPGTDQLWMGTSDQGTGKDRILKVTIK